MKCSNGFEHKWSILPQGQSGGSELNQNTIGQYHGNNTGECHGNANIIQSISLTWNHLYISGQKPAPGRADKALHCLQS